MRQDRRPCATTNAQLPKTDAWATHRAAAWTTRSPSGRPASPVLIYPTSAKYQLSYEQPYHEFMSRFQIALRQPDVGLLVVGFGFNDAHLVAPLEAAIRSNVGLRLAVITPDARADSRPEPLAWIEDLILRGDQRLAILNGTFRDLVRVLPKVAPLEERDAHEERVSRRRPVERS